MTAKRIRCTCGRIYDPVKHKKCPDCGAETVVATPAGPPPLPTPPKPKPSVAKSEEEPRGTTTPLSFPIPINRQTMIVIGGALFALIVIVLAVGHSGGKKRSGKVEHGGANTEPNPSPSATAHGNTTVVVIPPHGGGTESNDLAAMIASAAPGATVKIPAGLYRGGLVLPRAIRLVADSKMGGQVVIQSEGKECLSVRAAGVSVQNIQFFGNGIGDLPAISVADNGDLDMEGCKIQSGSAVGVTVSGNASIKALGSAITVTNGSALRLNQGAHGDFTQCSFSNSKIGLFLANGAVAELHACAFENNGMSDSNGAIMMITGAKTQATADDCQFTNNSGAINAIDGATLTVKNSPFKNNGESSRGGSFGLIVARNSAHATLTGDTFESNRYGVVAMDKSAVEIQKCSFDSTGFRQTQQISIGSFPISIIGQGSSGTIRNTVMTNSNPYGVSVFSGGTATLEEVEIYGSRAAGLVVGDRNGPSGHAEVKRCKFNRNTTGMGVCAGGSANVEESECRENNDGVLVIDRDSQLKLVKTAVASNKDYGLYVHGNAQATVLDSDIQANGRGAQSGTSRKSAERGSLRLEDSRIGGNRVFGIGVATQSELILNRCVFDGTDKTNVHKESGAVVQTDMVAETSPAPEATADPKTERNSTRRRSTPSPDSRRRAEDINRILRQFRP
jgi:parallel beta helix pectate lyase-like protein